MLQSRFYVTICSFLVVFLFLTVCESIAQDLTRGKAKNLLQKKKVFVSKQLIEPTVYQVTDENLLLLEKTGYIEIVEVPNGGVLRGQSRYDVIILDKLKPFVLERQPNGYKYFRIKLYDVVVDEITGITSVPMDPSAKLVKYKIKAIPTPLGKIGITLTNMEKVQLNQEAIFRKYDDGWRLEQ